MDVTRKKRRMIEEVLQSLKKRRGAKYKQECNRINGTSRKLINRAKDQFLRQTKKQ